jgi:hypothetical protein
VRIRSGVIHMDCHSPLVFRYIIRSDALTPLNRVLPEKLTGPQSRNSPHFMEPVASAICPYPTSRSILILSFHLLIGLQSGLFPSGLPTKTKHAPLLSPLYGTCPTHLELTKSLYAVNLFPLEMKEIVGTNMNSDCIQCSSLIYYQFKY